MILRDTLAQLKAQRHVAWRPSFGPDDARPAIHAFKGDVYQDLDAPTLSARDHNYAQNTCEFLAASMVCCALINSEVRSEGDNWEFTRKQVD